MQRFSSRGRTAAFAATESLEQRVLFSAIVVTTDADSGAGSLRQAIEQANASPSRDRIIFKIGSGAESIALKSPLPAVTRHVIIDATTQPGYAGAPLIELNGAGAGATADGLVITGGRSRVSGFVINRFGGNGIVLRGKGGDVIQGNYVGTNATGTAASPNGGDGLLVDGVTGNFIGGRLAAHRNVFSGNGSKTNFPTLARDGIHLHNANFNVIEGNYCGADATGTKPLGNSKFGIELDGSAFNLVGGTHAGQGNLVSDNTAGIEIDNGGNHNAVQGNLVGTQKDGVSPLGNTLHGVVFGVGQHNDHNLIGGFGPGAGNIIAQNGTAGVAVFGSTSTAVGNAILGNSIFSNGRSNPSFLLGIDLVPTLPFPTDDGVTPNDPGDADTGPNNVQNFPVLTSAKTTARGQDVSGTLDSTANTFFRIEFFANPDPNPNAHPEGQVLIGAVIVKTDKKGHAAFTAHVSGATNGGPLVTATATDQGGNTSEFSAAVRTTA
jgi:hypothetical protein